MERHEVEAVLGTLMIEDFRGSVIVHGAAGSGKSDVLCEVVDQLVEAKVTVLALKASEVAKKGIDSRLLDRLCRRCKAGERFVLVIDQVDQLLDSASGGPEAERAVVEATRRVLAAGGVLVLGCRTAEATASSQLGRIIRSAGDGECAESVEVGPLPVEAVSRFLQDLGVAYSSLSSGLQGLLRSPLALVLYARVRHGRSASHEVSTIGQLVHLWLEEMLSGDRVRRQAWARFVECYEGSPGFSVPEGLLTSVTGGVEQLLQVGVLLRRPAEEAGCYDYEARHQVVVDHELARMLGELKSSSDVLGQLPPKGHQGWKEARHLRLAAPLFALRTAAAPRLLDELLQSNDVRWLLKQGLLLGLADLPNAPSPPVRDCVLQWLDDPDLRRFVLVNVLRRGRRWVIACEEWLAEQWAPRDEPWRRALLGVLASVAVQEGDLAARVLGKWREDHGDAVLEAAAQVFPLDPSEDSEELFRMRMQCPRSYREAAEVIHWERLFNDHPDRAAILLVDRLEGLDDEELVSQMSRGQLDLDVDRLDITVAKAAQGVWDELKGWWRTRTVESLEVVDLSSANGARRASPLAMVVSLLAKCWAQRLKDHQVTWSQLVESEFPDRRELDNWLLLEIVQRLEGCSQNVIEDAARWMMQEPSVLSTSVGTHSERHQGFVVEQSLGAVSQRLVGMEWQAEFSKWQRGATLGFGRPSGSRALVVWGHRLNEERNAAAAERDDRSSDDWVDAVRSSPGTTVESEVDHLVRLATGPAESGAAAIAGRPNADRYQLQVAALNELRPSAMHALAAVAHEQESVRNSNGEGWVEAMAGLGNSTDPVMRIAAADLVMACQVEDWQGSFLNLADHPQVVGDPQVAGCLWSLVEDEGGEYRQAAIDVAMMGVKSCRGPLAREAGGLAFGLCSLGHLSATDAVQILSDELGSLEAFASCVGASLGEDPCRGEDPYRGKDAVAAWIHGAIQVMTQLEDSGLARSCAKALLRSSRRSAVEDKAVLEALLDIPPDAEFLDLLLEELDQVGELLPMATELLKLARQIYVGGDGARPPVITYHWTVYSAIDRIRRLIEECERKEDLKRRTEALDVLDGLIKQQPQLTASLDWSSGYRTGKSR